jgi:hypothetical protein
MSALGQKQTFGPGNAMSALPPKADIDRYPREVRFVPEADQLIKGLMMSEKCRVAARSPSSSSTIA